MMNKEPWEANLSEETAFWWKYLSTDESPIRERRETRLQPDRQLPKDIQKYLPEDGRSIRVLDIGAGPLTTMGTMFRDQPVELIAVDALAHEYDHMLDELGIDPPVRTIYGEGENLTEQFDADTFDAINCANALDHFYDPMKALVEGMQVLKAGGVFRVLTHQNVGEKMKYRGLHQWNFDIRDERLFLWNRSSETDVFEALSSLAQPRELYLTDADLVLFILQKVPA